VRLIGSKFKAFAPSEFVYLSAGVIEQARATRDRLKRWYQTP
jgi:hypothetical protein